VFLQNTTKALRFPYTECADLHASLTFGVSVPSPRSEGAVALYTCEIGYQLTSGSAQRTCLSSSAWDGIEPTCSKVTCSVIYHQVCYNCDIMDSDCPHVTTPATFDECRTAVFNQSSLYREHNFSNCKAFACKVPPVTYTNGSVAIFPSCNRG